MFLSLLGRDGISIQFPLKAGAGGGLLCDEMCLRRSVLLKADKALVIIEVLAFGRSWFAFLPLRPLSLGCFGINTSGSVCACRWERKEELMVGIEGKEQMRQMQSKRTQ